MAKCVSIDLLGQKFGRLLVISRASSSIGDQQATWVCLCDCGQKRTVRGYKLRSGHTKSCGCILRDFNRQRNTIHGLSHHPEFRVWVGMLRRCNNKNEPSYQRYGGVGIFVCDEWQKDFAAFYNYMGPRPSSDHSIDRIDNERGYEPGNCRWATRTEQSRNRRNIKIYEFQDNRGNLPELAEIYSIPVGEVRKRLWRGWTLERALLQPMRRSGPRTRQPTKLEIGKILDAG